MRAGVATDVALIDVALTDKTPMALAQTDGRRERSRRTRRSIVSAAIDLFVADGYGTTSISAIAHRAGVAVQTVYATFGSKRAILAAAVDQAIVGDDESTAVPDRDWMHDVFHASTAEQRLSAYAGAVRRIMHGAGDMFVVLATAASIDADVVELAASAEERRRMGARSVIGSVLSVGPLRAGLVTEEAIDILAMLNSPATFHQLVRSSNWTLDMYEAWLAETLIRDLLPPSPQS